MPPLPRATSTSRTWPARPRSCTTCTTPPAGSTPGLKLTRDVIAGIFTGEITSWNDPAITSQNGGIRFQEDAIKVVIRSERSGTTGLFYDFVQNTAPARFARFKQKQNIVSPDGIRIIQIPTPYPANWTGIEGSDKLARRRSRAATAPA
ncbi:substrate-binding domain-containing protein [Fodinicola feengrottensis]|uniref:substrate-binding domain-containing protein n=1 Tax=Fodinicola feengrottensis TaxID=435914 RepID=UPI0036F228B5